MATIPLDEIAPGATIRFTVIDGVQYLSTRDFIMHMCDKDNKRASETWIRMSQERKNELSAFCRSFTFDGRGQQEQPVITFPGAIKLAMFLPGENAKKNRSIMAKILVRYFAGDPSLIPEIEANAASEAPVAQMARASLASEEDEEAFRLARKRQFEEIEMEERKVALDMKKTNALAEKIELYSSLCSAYPSMDERARLILKDVVLNLVTNPGGVGQPQIALGVTGQAPVGPGSFLTISTVATEQGYKFDSSQLKRLGARIAQAYFHKYYESPPKHEQFVDGAVRKINTYQAKDRDLIVREIKDFAFHADFQTGLAARV